MPSVIQKKYSFEKRKVSSLTLPPNMASIPSSKARYIAVTVKLTSRLSTTEQPTLRCASSRAPEPRQMLTKAQQPSPIITARARATTVSGKTTVFAALP